MGAYGNGVQGAVILLGLVVHALGHSAVDVAVAFTIHLFFLLQCDFNKYFARGEQKYYFLLFVRKAKD